ncbi:MAG: glycogen/starch synthase [Treponema sp.]
MSMKSDKKSVWFVSREYAGIAEAGGVKNVVQALAEAARAHHFEVVVFLPLYGSCPYQDGSDRGTVLLRIGGILHTVQYRELDKDGIRFIFIAAELFSEKRDIYTYCAEELAFFREKLHRNDLQKGQGYVDSHEMNVLFQKAVYCFALKYRCAPAVLHCHDAHTALLPAFIGASRCGRALFHTTQLLITIHNAGDGYRQSIPSVQYAWELTRLPFALLQSAVVDTMVEPFLVGAHFAALTTVSSWYAEQLHDPACSPYSYRFTQAIADSHIPIIGITNGIDSTRYDAACPAVSQLPFAFDIGREDFDGKYACRAFFLEQFKSGALQRDPAYTALQWFGSCEVEAEKKYVYVMYHGRFVHQKGVSVLLKSIPLILQKAPFVRCILMGQGNSGLEEEAMALTQSLKGACLYCKGYDRQIARLLTAAADFILLPSLFEPCGLEDFIAQLYGTIPVAHAEGGLQKIIHGQTGFLYQLPAEAEREGSAHVEQLAGTVLALAERAAHAPFRRLLDDPFFRKIIVQAYQTLLDRYSWQTIFTDYYVPLYEKAAGKPFL